ncbi:MAG: VWA domain-containing protein [Armatimonadetes bacterium]|nr:VWA domain-containing protein [Armatimonadota bacterium]MDW8121348.1 VWA domain-containing protein [Armatimonadota bacterium]
MTESFSLAYPYIAIGAAALYGLISWGARGKDTFPYPSLSLFLQIGSDWRQTISRILRAVAVIALIGALGRPQWATTSVRRIEGVDIVIALDVSSSMSATDFRPNRLEAAKEVITRFLDLLASYRSGDRVGLVAFSGEAFTACPLTNDLEFVKDAVLTVPTAQSGAVRDGTAIGDGLTVAIARLSSSPAKSRIIILASDGENNTGRVEPPTGAQYAKERGIRIYTIGIGSERGTSFFIDPATGRTSITRHYGFNPDLLRRLAATTGGTYFFAGDEGTLEAILRVILQLETTPLVVKKEKTVQELSVWLIGLSLMAFLLDGFLSHFVWRRVP